MAAKFAAVTTGIALVDQNLKRLESALATIQGPAAPNVVSVSGDYKVNGNEDVIHVDASRGPIRITLPSPSSAARPLTIKQVNLQNGKSKVNPVTVMSANGQKTIAGSASYVLDSSGTGSVALTADDQQHWPAAGAGGNPAVLPAAPPAPPFIPPPPPTPPPPTPPVITVPWVAPVSTGGALEGDKTGAETWQAEWTVDFSGAATLITLYWWFQALSSAGTGTFNIRIGGSTYKALDGAIVATWGETSPTMTGRSVSAPIATPIGIQRVTLTAQASTAGALAQCQGVNLLFR